MLEQHTIINEYKTLEKKSKKTFYQSFNLRHDIELLNIISPYLDVDKDRFDIKINVDLYKEKLRIKNEKKEDYLFNSFIASNYDSILNTIKSYNKFLEEISFIACNGFNSEKSILNEDACEIVLSFFNSVGQEEYRLARKLLEEERVINVSQIEGDYCGLFYGTRELKDSYYILFSGKKYNINTMATMAHELGHAIEFSKTNDKNNFYKKSVNPLIEISSNFYEIEFLKYLQKNNYNNFETNNVINTYIYERIHMYFNYLFTILDDIYVDEEGFYEFLDKDYYILDDKFARVYTKYDEDLNCTDTTGIIYFKYKEIVTSIKYGLGLYIALHFSQLKEQNPKEFKKKFNRFLTMRTLMDYKGIIEGMGMSLKDYEESSTIKNRIIDDQKKLKRSYGM